jgi:hypothetical protein
MSKFKLPDEITKSEGKNARDLVIIAMPKMGKSTIFGKFTEENNALILSLEKGGYEFINARKMEIYPEQDVSIEEGFNNYIEIRNLLLKEKNKYKYLLVDGLSDLDSLSEIGGTYAYMNSIIGKKFNRVGNKEGGDILNYNDPNFKSVLTLPDGAGFSHTRSWFLQQIEFFRQISPYRIYAAHVADKYIRDSLKDEVVGSEILLTGKLKNIFASKVTALAKLSAEDNKRFLNFDVANDSIIAGSRDPKLKGKILISDKNEEGNIITHWDKIYK